MWFKNRRAKYRKIEQVPSKIQDPMSLPVLNHYIPVSRYGDFSINSIIKTPRDVYETQVLPQKQSLNCEVNTENSSFLQYRNVHLLKDVYRKKLYESLTARSIFRSQPQTI